MKRKILISLILGLSTVIGYSQADSIKVEYSQEEITKANKKDEAICDVLTTKEKKKKDLWKFNLMGAFFGGVDIAYERKSAAKWSFGIQSVTNFYKDIYGENLEEY